MDSNDKSYLDIDELAKRIEERIKALENKEVKEEVKSEVKKETKKDEKVSDLDKIIEEIDKRIQELDEEAIEEFDVNELMNKVNEKLASDESSDETDDGTMYDLSEITKAINETIKALEEKRRKKKAEKARYCDLARKKAYIERNKK